MAHKGQCNKKWFAANKKIGCKQQRKDANNKDTLQTKKIGCKQKTKTRHDVSSSLDQLTPSVATKREQRNFRPKGDGRSGPRGPLLPEKNLTFWDTKLCVFACRKSHGQWYVFFIVVLSNRKLDLSFFFMAGPKSANLQQTSVAEIAEENNYPSFREICSFSCNHSYFPKSSCGYK